MADYGMQELAYELNLEGARLAREAAQLAFEIDGKRRFVAGALGPLNKTASMSTDVNSPGHRAITFDEIVNGYAEEINGLIDGGADLLLFETITDTLNTKAGIFAGTAHLRRARQRAAGDDLGHDHRPVGPHALGPDADGVLVLGAARQALHHRAQLRARRQRHARAHRRAERCRGHADLRLPECRAAERIRRL